MHRFIAAALLALTIGSGVAAADPVLRDAIRTGSIISTGGIWDARW